MNKKNEMLIAIGLMLVILILIGFLIYNMTTEGGKCYLNPTGYALKQIEKQAGSEVLCSCTFMKHTINPIYLDSNGFTDKPYYSIVPFSIQNNDSN